MSRLVKVPINRNIKCKWRLYLVLLSIFQLAGLLCIMLYHNMTAERSTDNFKYSIPEMNTDNLEQLNISFINCNNSYKLRHSMPPYLISAMGSGNTFTRLLIELLTNFYTGTVHGTDFDLEKAGFIGDNRCDDSVIMLKAHAGTFLESKKWNGFLNGSFWFYKKCLNLRVRKNRCNNKNKEMNAIFILRNPFDTFLSEYQRRITKSHIGNVMKQHFEIETFKKKLIFCVKQYMEILFIYNEFKEINRDVLLIRFE
eukprot:348841_1